MLRDTPTYMSSGEQRPPAEAIPNDWESQLRPLSRWQIFHAISGASSYNSFNEAPRNISKTLKFEQVPLLEPQSSEFMPPVDQSSLRVFPTRVSHNADGVSLVDTTRESSIHLRNSRTSVTPERQQVQSSSTGLPKSYDLRPKLPPRDYHEKVIQNKIQPKKRCIRFSERAVSSNQLLQNQKRDAIIDLCQRTPNFHSSSDVHNNPNVHNFYTTFRQSAQSTPPKYSER